MSLTGMTPGRLGVRKDLKCFRDGSHFGSQRRSPDRVELLTYARTRKKSQFHEGIFETFRGVGKGGGRGRKETGDEVPCWCCAKFARTIVPGRFSHFYLDRTSHSLRLTCFKDKKMLNVLRYCSLLEALVSSLRRNG